MFMKRAVQIVESQANNDLLSIMRYVVNEAMASRCAEMPGVI